jgi:hypothetical protein
MVEKKKNVLRISKYCRIRNNEQGARAMAHHK